MLRESSVPYSSLPQEEGEQTYVTTRTSGEPNTNNKGRILSIVLVLLLICGVPLMIIAPLALSKGSGRSVTSVSQTVDWTLPHSGHNENNDTFKDNQSTLINTATRPAPVAVPLPGIKNTTLKLPATTTKSTTTTTTTTTTTPTTTTTTTTPAPVTTRSIVILPTESVLKPSVEVPVGEAGKNQSGAVAGTTEVSQSQKGEEGSEGGSVSGSPEGRDNDGLSYTSTQGISSMMNNLMTRHEWWTLVAVAVAAALAIATVIATMTWIIHNRLASRRRRTNLEKVITDLQSRDKIVLLNSEDSEDEA